MGIMKTDDSVKRLAAALAAVLIFVGAAAPAAEAKTPVRRRGFMVSELTGEIVREIRHKWNANLARL